MVVVKSNTFPTNTSKTKREKILAYTKVCKFSLFRCFYPIPGNSDNELNAK